MTTAAEQLLTIETAPASKGDLSRHHEANTREHEQIASAVKTILKSHEDQITAQNDALQKTLLAGQEKIETVIEKRYRRIELGMVGATFVFALLYSALTVWGLGLYRSLFGIM